MTSVTTSVMTSVMTSCDDQCDDQCDDPHEQVVTQPANALFTQLIERVCVNPGTESTTTMLNWLLQNTGCHLTTTEGQRLLETLRGQHIHIWQESDDYHILVVSNHPHVGHAPD